MKQIGIQRESHLLKGIRKNRIYISTENGLRIFFIVGHVEWDLIKPENNRICFRLVKLKGF